MLVLALLFFLHHCSTNCTVILTIWCYKMQNQCFVFMLQHRTRRCHSDTLVNNICTTWEKNKTKLIWNIIKQRYKIYINCKTSWWKSVLVFVSLHMLVLHLIPSLVSVLQLWRRFIPRIDLKVRPKESSLGLMESEFRIILGRPRGFLLDAIVPGCEPEYLAITLVFTRKNAYRFMSWVQNTKHFFIKFIIKTILAEDIISFADLIALDNLKLYPYINHFDN